tara:strand:+ start:498 stop:785 length:288 start_codon:yes stop_codon:yes gene_type:complete
MTAFYTPQELADRWKVSARTVVRMTEAGDLPHIKVGKKIRIPAHALATVEGDTTCTTINLKNAVAGSTGTYTGERTESRSMRLLARQMRRLQRPS